MYNGSYSDYPITNGTASITVPDNISTLEIGVYSGRLTTTNRASIQVLPSILRGEVEEIVTSTCIRIDTDDANQKINSVWISHNGGQFQPVSYARVSGQQGSQNISPVWKFKDGYGVFGMYYGAFNIVNYESGEDEEPMFTDAGTLAYTLNPDNLKESLSGYEFSGRYNIFLVIPTLYWKAVGNSLYVADREDYGEITGMVAYAHTGSGDVYDCLCIGVYEGGVDEITQCLLSVSGAVPTTSMTHDNFKRAADRLDSDYGDYQQWNFYQWTLYKILAYAIMGTKNSQWMIGLGNVGSESLNVTGLADYYGAYEADDTVSKMLIENPWGNAGSIIGDAYCDNLVICAGSTLGGADVGSQPSTGVSICDSSSQWRWVDGMTKDSICWDVPTAIASSNNAENPYKSGDSFASRSERQSVIVVGGEYNRGRGAGLGCIATHLQLTFKDSREGTRLAYLFNNN